MPEVLVDDKNAREVLNSLKSENIKTISNKEDCTRQQELTKIMIDVSKREISPALAARKFLNK